MTRRNDIITVYIVVVAVAAAIHRVDVGRTCEADVCVYLRQRCVTVRGNIITRRKNTVGDLTYLSRTVVAAIKGTVELIRHADGATRHDYLVATQDGGHITTAKHIAHYFSAIHAQRCQSHKLRERPVTHCGIRKAHW